MTYLISKPNQAVPCKLPTSDERVVQVGSKHCNGGKTPSEVRILNPCQVLGNFIGNAADRGSIKPFSDRSKHASGSDEYQRAEFASVAGLIQYSCHVPAEAGRVPSTNAFCQPNWVGAFPLGTHSS